MDLGKSSASKQHTVVESTLTKAHEHTTNDQPISGNARDPSAQSGQLRPWLMINHLMVIIIHTTLLNLMFSHPRQSPRRQGKNLKHNEKKRPKPWKTNIYGQTEGYDQEYRPVTTLPYKGLQLPIRIIWTCHTGGMKIFLAHQNLWIWVIWIMTTCRIILKHSELFVLVMSFYQGCLAFYMGEDSTR